MEEMLVYEQTKGKYDNICNSSQLLGQYMVQELV